MNRLLILLLAVVIVVPFSGCGKCSNTDIQSNELSEWIGKDWIGKSVTVQFRRDILGTESDLPVGPNTDNINGAETVVSGTLLKVNADSIVVENNVNIAINEKMSQRWIPREVILLVEMKP